MSTDTEENFEFILAKTVAELKDLCRIHSIRGYSGLRKDELCDLLITYYKSNPESLKMSPMAGSHKIQVAINQSSS